MRLRCEYQQIGVAADECVGRGCERELQEGQVIGIAACRHLGWLGGHARGFDPRQIVGEQVVLLIGRELELGVGEYADQFDDRVAARQWYEQLCLPGEAKPAGDTAGTNQGGQHHAGVEYPARRRACAHRLPGLEGLRVRDGSVRYAASGSATRADVEADARRAHAIAAARSSSPRSSSASLARTASARCMRTGVNTSWPARVSISKYSARPTASTAAFGRVSWFLEVIFASMRVPIE